MSVFPAVPSQELKRKDKKSQEISFASTALEHKRANEKTVNVEKDERFVKINIESKLFPCKNREVYIRTAIVKDKELNTTRTQTKKIFVHYTKGKANLILREIDTDRSVKKRQTNHKSIHVELDQVKDFQKKVNLLFGSSKEQEEPIKALSA